MSEILHMGKLKPVSKNLHITYKNMGNFSFINIKYITENVPCPDKKSTRTTSLLTALNYCLTCPHLLTQYSVAPCY